MLIVVKREDQTAPEVVRLYRLIEGAGDLWNGIGTVGLTWTYSAKRKLGSVTAGSHVHGLGEQGRGKAQKKGEQEKAAHR